MEEVGACGDVDFGHFFERELESAVLCSRYYERGGLQSGWSVVEILCCPACCMDSKPVLLSEDEGSVLAVSSA
jgi:hypothetical protein